MALHTMSLKTTAEALYNRNQVLESFEKAQNTSNLKEREKLMTFIIVGGGATGIELSGALAEMRKFILPKDYPDLDCPYRCRPSPTLGFLRKIVNRSTGLSGKKRS